MALKDVDSLHNCTRNEAKDAGGSDLWSPTAVTQMQSQMLVLSENKVFEGSDLWPSKTWIRCVTV